MLLNDPTVGSRAVSQEGRQWVFETIVWLGFLGRLVDIDERESSNKYKNFCASLQISCLFNVVTAFSNSMVMNMEEFQVGSNS